MDPLSISVSLITILELSATLLKACHAYRTTIKSAPRDLLRIQTEISIFRSTVHNVHQLLADASLLVPDGDDGDDESMMGGDHVSNLLPNLRALAISDGPLAQSLSDLTLLERKLAPPISDSRLRATGRALTWPFREGEVTKTLEHLSRVRSSLQLALLADTMSSTLVIRDTTSSMAESMKIGLERLTARLEEREFNDEYLAIRRWLFDGAEPTNHSVARRIRARGSGDWLLKLPEYVAWSEGGNGVLWLYGMAGCGKTVLLSRAVDELKDRFRDASSVAVAYHYFDFNDQKENTADAMMRELLAQICGQSRDVSADLKRLFEQRMYWKYRDGSFAEKVEGAFNDQVKDFDHVYLLLDGLDECHNGVDLEGVLGALKRASQSSRSAIHILVTSRFDRDLQVHFQDLGAVSMNLQETELATDVQLFVQQRLHEDIRLRRQPTAVRKEIESALITGADGSFRWAACQASELNKCSSTKVLRSTLRSLPTTLTQTYTRMLESIDLLNRPAALKILRWVAFSCRPLGLQELVEAIAIDIESSIGPSYDPDLLLWDPYDILSICSGLVTAVVQKETATNGHEDDLIQIRLAHFSVKEFLTSSKLRTSPMSEFLLAGSPVHAYIVRSSLAYLMYIKEPLNTENIEQYPLARYAAAFWIEHLRLLEPGPDRENTQTDILRFVQDKKQLWFSNWVRLHQADAPWRGPSLDKAPEAGTPLYYMAYLGLERQVETLLTGGSDPNVPGGLYHSPIQAAAYRGFTNVVRLLINAKADLENHGGIFGNALRAAVSQDHYQIVQLLLESGQSPKEGINSFSIRGSLLTDAAREGNMEMCELLLRFGANLFHRDLKAHPAGALDNAVANGHVNVVKLLLRRASLLKFKNKREESDWALSIKISLEQAKRSGNDEMFSLLLTARRDNSDAFHLAAQMKSGEYAQHLLEEGFELDHQLPTSLEYAALGGHLELVRALIEQGANPLGQPYSGSTLSAAARGGNLEIVRLMVVDFKAPINVGRHFPLCPLGQAAESGHLEVLKFLISSGAEVDYHSGEALRRAASMGRVEIAQELLDQGASIDIENEWGQTALYFAALAGSSSLVQMLIDHGAPINHHGGRDGNPLHAAIKNGHADVVELLLNRGANIEQLWNKRTPLMTARLYGQDFIFRQLLAMGSCVNPSMEDGESPLELAISRERGAMVDILLDRGVEVNVPGTPLTAAVTCRLESHVEALLNKGADPNAAGSASNGPEYALKLAAEWGNIRILRLLVENGANVNQQNAQGFTALHVAAKRGDKAMLDLLLHGYKADIKVRLQNGSLPIHSAASRGQTSCIEAFLELGVDIDVANNEGLTPLHWTAEEGYWDTVQYLLERGANVTLKDGRGFTALDLAEVYLETWALHYMFKNPDDPDVWTIKRIRALFERLKPGG